MIHRKVSAALLLRDGYTGLPFRSGAEVFVWVDGVLVRPVFKEGGYLVLTDLPPGGHELLLRRRGFQDARLDWEVLADGPAFESEIDLLPGRGYPFREEPLRLELGLFQGETPLAGETLWSGRHGAFQLKLAQDGAEGTEVRLVHRGGLVRLPVPGHFLAADEKGPELLRLLRIEGERGFLERPPALPHKRGTPLIPMCRSQSDGAGRVSLLLREAGTFSLFCRGQWKKLELERPGAQLDWRCPPPI